MIDVTHGNDAVHKTRSSLLKRSLAASTMLGLISLICLQSLAYADVGYVNLGTIADESDGAVNSGVAPDDDASGVSGSEGEWKVPPSPDGDDGLPVTDAPVCVNPYSSQMYWNEGIVEPESHGLCELLECIPETLSWPVEPLTCFTEFVTGSEHDEPETELSNHALGLQPVPDRPDLLIETDELFLGSGFLSQGLELPSGAVWRPALWVFGQYRTGYQYAENRQGGRISEWAQRLDLFAQVNLTGTERVLFGIRPVDQQLNDRREFSSYDFNSGDWIDGWNADVQTLFFEGDFGELFPNLDPYDRYQLDYGFSVGRQPLLAQQGLLINEDLIDAVTVTRNTLSGHGNLNLRMTGVYAWDEVNQFRSPTSDDQLVALLTESDFKTSTVNADVAFLNSNNSSDSLVAVGLSAIQRLHGNHSTYNSSMHVLASFPTEKESVIAGRGVLLFNQLSWTPHHTLDNLYVNTFWAIDQFTSAGRGPLAGGPLGQTGILFAASGLGRFGPPLSNAADSAAGASLGYQLFFNHTRDQLIFEVGGRKDTNQVTDGAVAAGMRYQKALGQHWIMVLDGFAAKRETQGVAPGARCEFLAKF